MKKEPKVTLLLGGCGHRDGSEIQEAVFAMLAMSQHGIAFQAYAPDSNQAAVLDHLTGEPATYSRNILKESARIARGEILPISEWDASNSTGLVIPGGSGIAANFCDFASAQSEMQVDPKVAEIIRLTHQAKKPQVAICIAPVITARVLSDAGVTVTLGHHEGIASIVEGWGAKHQLCDKGDCVVDKANLVVTTPAYMHGDSTVAEVYAGISKAIGKVLLESP